MRNLTIIGLAVVLAGILAAAAAPVSAQSPPPRYDPHAHCNEVAEFGGTRSETTYVTCLEIEQDAYDGLKARWGDLQGTVRSHCDEVARFGGAGSYSTLSTCVDMELDAAQGGANTEFKF